MPVFYMEKRGASCLAALTENTPHLSFAQGFDGVEMGAAWGGVGRGGSV